MRGYVDFILGSAPLRRDHESRGVRAGLGGKPVLERYRLRFGTVGGPSAFHFFGVAIETREETEWVANRSHGRGTHEPAVVEHPATPDERVGAFLGVLVLGVGLFCRKIATDDQLPRRLLVKSDRPDFPVDDIKVVSPFPLGPGDVVVGESPSGRHLISWRLKRLGARCIHACRQEQGDREK